MRVFFVMVLIMNDLFQDIFDVLQEQFIRGRVDPAAYAAIKGSILVFQQRLESVNLVHAIDLYNAVKAVIDV